MLALLFNHQRNLRADLAGYGAGGQVKTGTRRNRNIHGAGHGLQIPIIISTWITLDGHAAGSGMSFDVAIRAAYVDGSAGGVCVYSTARLSYLNIAGNRMRNDVSFGIRDDD